MIERNRRTAGQEEPVQVAMAKQRFDAARMRLLRAEQKAEIAVACQQAAQEATRAMLNPMSDAIQAALKSAMDTVWRGVQETLDARDRATNDARGAVVEARRGVEIAGDEYRAAESEAAGNER